MTSMLGRRRPVLTKAAPVPAPAPPPAGASPLLGLDGLQESPEGLRFLPFPYPARGDLNCSQRLCRCDLGHLGEGLSVTTACGGSKERHLSEAPTKAEKISPYGARHPSRPNRGSDDDKLIIAGIVLRFGYRWDLLTQYLVSRAEETEDPPSVCLILNDLEVSFELAGYPLGHRKRVSGL